jgi:small redox-active disulfide protein 2
MNIGKSIAEVVRMEIKILGPGCINCERLAEAAKQAVSELGIEAEVAKVTDFAVMASYGMMASPGLVINEKLVSSGRIPSVKDIKAFIEIAGT